MLFGFRTTFCDNQRGHNTNDKTQPQSTDTLPGTIFTPKRHQTLPHRQACPRRPLGQKRRLTGEWRVDTMSCCDRDFTVPRGDSRRCGVTWNSPQDGPEENSVGCKCMTLNPKPQTLNPKTTLGLTQAWSWQSGLGWPHGPWV